MKRTIECDSVAEFLNIELQRRKQRNGSYSLRAFARDLTISPSRLSEVMKGNVGLSEKNADTITAQLQLKPRERQYVRDLILKQSSRSAKGREFAKARVEEARRAESFGQMKEQQFQVIADWYHGALLELPQLKDFRSDATWIAARLGISVAQVEAAVERLKKLNLLKCLPNDEWRSNPGAYETFSAQPSAAIRRYHRQILSMALDSLDYDSMDDREFYSTIIAIPKKKMPEFAEAMRKFITMFWKNIEHDEKDDLCALSLQLFQIRDRRQRYRKEK